MRNSIKKFMALTMLLSFTLTTQVSSSLVFAAGGDLGYSMDYMPEIRGSQPSIVSFESAGGVISDTNPTISLSLRDSDVKQVLRMFADKAGKNIIFKGDVGNSSSGSSEGGGSGKGKITMDLVNIPLNSAFNMVLAASDLTYTLQDNTIIVADAKDSSSIGKQEMAVVPVRYINATQIANFLNKNIYGMQKPGLSSSNIASVNPATNEILIFGNDNDVAVARRVIAQFDKKPSVTSFKVNHTTPQQMAEMICGMLLPSTGDVPDGKSTGGAAGVVTGGASDSSSSSSSSSGGSGSSITLGEGAIACSSSVTSGGSGSGSGSGGTSAEPLGLHGLTVAYYTQLGTINLIGGSPHQVELIKEFIAANDKRQPQAYIEFSIIELSETGTREFNNEWSFVSKHFKFNYDSTGTNFNKIALFGDKPTYTTGSTTLLYSLSLMLKNGKARTISNPRVLVTNGQESTVDMTEDYVKTVTSQIVQGSYSNVPTVERTYEIGDDMGLKINVTPFISPDGFVYLNVKPDYSTKAGDVKVKNAETGEEDLQATLLRKNNIELKNIRIKDGDTLVIAGMMKENETKSVSKIPFLGDIPGLGTLFRTSSTEKTKTELVILITPKIINDNDAPATAMERPTL
ncbi:MAG: secretin N-terminal domain-containing protein [Candidatus Gastranaerophilaceae bacterium]|nr:secretin N-terminal domain-containing protein [Candidatus Gastranaerophilaceae bacterium]